MPHVLYASLGAGKPHPYVNQNLALQHTPLGTDVVRVCPIRCLIIFGVIDCTVLIVVVGYIIIHFPTVQLDNINLINVMLYLTTTANQFLFWSIPLNTQEPP